MEDGGFYFLRPCRYYSHLLEGCSTPGMIVKMMTETDHVVMLGRIWCTGGAPQVRQMSLFAPDFLSCFFFEIPFWWNFAPFLAV